MKPSSVWIVATFLLSLTCAAIGQITGVARPYSGLPVQSQSPPYQDQYRSGSGSQYSQYQSNLNSQNEGSSSNQYQSDQGSRYQGAQSGQSQSAQYQGGQYQSGQYQSGQYQGALGRQSNQVNTFGRGDARSTQVPATGRFQTDAGAGYHDQGRSEGQHRRDGGTQGSFGNQSWGDQNPGGQSGLSDSRYQGGAGQSQQHQVGGRYNAQTGSQSNRYQSDSSGSHRVASAQDQQTWTADETRTGDESWTGDQASRLPVNESQELSPQRRQFQTGQFQNERDGLGGDPRGATLQSPQPGRPQITRPADDAGRWTGETQTRPPVRTLPNSGRFSGRQDLPVSANPRATDGGVPLGGRPLASPPGDAGQRSSTNPLGPPQANQQPSAPPFGPLSERHRQQVDLLLRYWEFSTKDISYYQCEFKRWDWDPNFGPKQFAREYSMGEIKFEQPDKGLYKVNRSEVFRKTDPTNPSKPLYEPLDTPGDHWVCDGTHIYQYDYPNRVIKKRTLPPNVQGPKIINGPLPFLLSAKAADIKRRFWLRLVQPPENMRDTFWLEAYPKGREDAGNFQFVRIILDTQVDRKYLPRALVIFSPGYDPVRNPSRTTYEFEQRQVNPLHISLNVFRQSFYNIRPDSGWRVDDADIGVPAERPAARESRRGLLPSFGRR